jgi:hypothetical protein
MALVASNQVECEVLIDKEWEMLEQIVSVLGPLAFFQRVLEGESYVTGSMVPSAVFNIRRLIKAKSEHPDTKPAVS